MSLIDVDSWSVEHDACSRLGREIQSQIALRDREPRLSDEYSKLSAATRIRLKQFANELEQLEYNLTQSRFGQITTGEQERRQRQIEQLQLKLNSLQKQFSGLNVGGNLETSSRLWMDEDDDDEPILKDDERSVESLRSRQIKMIEDQNTGLENLSKVISRQKDIAITIGDEVQYQNDLIDVLAYNMEDTDVRIASGTRQVTVVLRNDSVCVYWVTIICLLVVILLLIFLF